MRETGGLEHASTITLALQAHRLTKCASHLLSAKYLDEYLIFAWINVMNTWILGFYQDLVFIFVFVCIFLHKAEVKYCLIFLA